MHSIKLLLSKQITGYLLAWLLVACTTPLQSPSIPPTITEEIPAGLSQDEYATLNSLSLVESYPLYTLTYYGDYHQRSTSNLLPSYEQGFTPQWACSLFAALGDPKNALAGRNFDWVYSPAVLLFTNPPDGYASVSMVDIAYLGFSETEVANLDQAPLEKRLPLLDAPFLPFDGMNDQGLFVGMAAVPPGDMHPNPDKPTLDSLGIIREILDHAIDTEEAVSILSQHNIDMGSGPPLHYLVADVSGRAVLVEFYQGKMHLFPNEQPWHLATNFLLAAVEDSPSGQCWRYDRIDQHLRQSDGILTPEEAMQLLAEVSQDITQWSMVYNLSTGDIHVVMGGDYNLLHTFDLTR